MIPAPFVVVLDANVLFPFTLRDTLLRAGAAGDRHVVAAAVRAGAQVITTSNVRDFTPLPDGLGAQSPDEFLSNLFDLDPDALVDVLREQAADLRRPPVTVDDLLARLALVAPDFVAAVRAHVGGPP